MKEESDFEKERVSVWLRKRHRARETKSSLGQKHFCLNDKSKPY